MKEIDPILYVVDTEGNILTSNRPVPPGSAKNVAGLLDGKEGTKEIKDGLEPEYVVKRKIENNHELLAGPW